MHVKTQRQGINNKRFKWRQKRKETKAGKKEKTIRQVRYEKRLKGKLETV
jgi:hypothetical protein